jgi:excisionase family DNA binding protein
VSRAGKSRKRNRWLSVKQVAELLGVSPKTVRRRLRERRYRIKRIRGGHGVELRILESDVFKDVQRGGIGWTGDEIRDASPAAASDSNKALDTGPAATLDTQETTTVLSIANWDDLPEVEAEFLATPKVLVLDDRKALGLAVRKMARRIGLDCLIAGSTQEALQLLEIERPVLVVSEVAVGDEEEFNFVRQKSRKKWAQNIPVVICSYLTQYSYYQRGKAFPSVLEYFNKPLIEVELERFRQFFLDFKKELDSLYGLRRDKA